MIYLLSVIFIGVCTQAQDTVVDVTTQESCGPAIIDYKGISDTYDPTVIFDNSQLKVSPPKPKIPGCFTLIANNVQIRKPLRTLSAEFEMRTELDPSIKPFKCKKKLGTECGCGIDNDCMYCDFCKNLKKHVPSLSVARTLRSFGANAAAHKIEVFVRENTREACKCKIDPGVYDIEAKICTPTNQELNDILPASILNRVRNTASKDFTLFTTIVLYDDRFSDSNPHVNQAYKSLWTDKLKAKHTVGCHVIGTNVEVDE